MSPQIKEQSQVQSSNDRHDLIEPLRRTDFLAIWQGDAKYSDWLFAMLCTPEGTLLRGVLSQLQPLAQLATIGPGQEVVQAKALRKGAKIAIGRASGYQKCLNLLNCELIVRPEVKTQISRPSSVSAHPFPAS